jgi:hypothetical protein
VHPVSASIQQTIREFRLGCSEWEDGFLSLLNDVDRFVSTDIRTDPAPRNAASVAEDIAGLRGLVEQQTEVLSALVDALTGPSAVADSENEARRNEPEFDPFERLQEVVAAASTAS